MQIKSATYVISGTKMSHFPPEGKPEFMLCGRSNVGKSSFINCVLNKKNLARTSSKPGKTQTINFFLINEEFYFVDVPGYGYASVGKEKKESFGKMIEEYFTKRKSLSLVFLLVDFRHEPTNDDYLMINFIRHFNKNVVVIATKKDKVKKSLWVKQEKLIRSKLKMSLEDPLIICSSLTKEGIDKVHEIISEELAKN